MGGVGQGEVEAHRAQQKQLYKKKLQNVSFPKFMNIHTYTLSPFLKGSLIQCLKLYKIFIKIWIP